MGILDRPRVPGAAGLDGRLRPRRGRATRPACGATRPSIPSTTTSAPVVDPLKHQVRDPGLWACHLGPELGGEGYGQVKLSLMNEILGRTPVGAASSSGTQAPDTGQRRDHRPLRDRGAEGALPAARCSTGRSSPRYSMTEPQGGSDPTLLRDHGPPRTATNGSSTAGSSSRPTPGRRPSSSSWPITDPESDVTRGCRCSWSPPTRPGSRSCATSGSWASTSRRHEGMHALIHYDEVRVPAESLLGGEGQAFAIAQTRLGGGRVHHAMRTVGMCQKALDMMCERALSAARPRDGVLADKQSCRTTWPTPTSSSCSSGSSCSTWPGHRPVPGLPQVRPGHRRHQGPHPAGPARHRPAFHPGPRRARCLQRDAAGRLVDDGCRSWAWSTGRPRSTASPWPARS